MNFSAVRDTNKDCVPQSVIEGPIHMSFNTVLAVVLMIIALALVIRVIAGLLRSIQIRGQTALELLKGNENREIPEIKMKIFVPKHETITIEDYAANPPKEFWEKVKKRTWEEMKSKKSDIDADKLEVLAVRTNYPKQSILHKVLSDLRYGAKIGVAEEFRVESISTNAPSAIESGREVTDALLEWLEEGYVIGPFDKNEIPFDKAKISGLMCKIKPNGKARIIVNLSKGNPFSVNDGIYKEDFPTAMSSTTAWVRILWRCGSNARFSKNDWSSAYKQIRVHQQDIWMQGFSWLGKIFFELALVFGSSSSPGIFDRLAKIVLYIAVKQSEFPSHLVIQHLDDVVACSPEGSSEVDRFHRVYEQVCDDLKIKMADKSDPDKAFSPRTEGQVLGVDYDSTTMTWHLRQDKMSAILFLLREIMEEGEASFRMLKKLCGKLVDIRDLIPGSKFHLAHLLMVSGSVTEKSKMDDVVAVDDWCRADLHYFSVVLPTYSRRTKLQDPDRKPDSWAIQSFTDAAGGSVESKGRGVGMTIYPYIWTYVPWGRRINEGWSSYDGKNLAHKLSAWELLGPLLTLVCGGNRLSGKQVQVFVDNSGSVALWEKGWSTVCDLCNTILVALHQVSTALACDLFLTNIGRCSTREAEAADALSKCDMRRFLDNMPEANIAPDKVPGALLKWIENPVPDRQLGGRIILEMTNKWHLITYS